VVLTKGPNTSAPAIATQNSEADMNRRSLLKISLAAAGQLVTSKLAFPAVQASAEWRHGISQLGEVKYPVHFPHFEYVNPKAPKGGVARQIGLGTFDSFNLALSGVKGVVAQGIDLLYDQLLVASLDEPASYYGLLAEAVGFPQDYSWVSFRLRREAVWHDGKPVTVDDVIFSFEALRKLSPQSAADYRHVRAVQQSAAGEVTFHIAEPGIRELPVKLGTLTVFPKHWWTGTDANGKTRSIEETTLDPPLGSGPYKIKQFSPGRAVAYERVADYWGKAVNVNIGRDNFDELRFEYYRDATVAFEGFKSQAADWRIENSAKRWAIEYDFSAVADKKVIREEFPIANIGIMQAFAFNIRRDKFKDEKVRLAFNFALNFEELNKQLFYGQYKRISSYFENTDLAATGLPSALERELLEPLRGQIPAEVFKAEYSNPTNSNPGAVRDNLRQAIRLFSEAGFDVREQQLVNRTTGEPFSVELLSNSPLFERVYLYYKPALERLGINVSVRTVDAAQYENRLRNWDFDVVTFAWGESLVPGNEQRGYWGSAAADQAGSYNIVGIKNPAVDTLINKVIYAADRDHLVAACRALDRVLLWNHYVVPQWSYSKMRTARWDRFGRPETLPKYGMSAFPTVWWLDQEKDAKIGNR
jgi:microcin C transport system substrate-binding protein